tara:strand:+ start:286738 stop:286890 length:153 start_codon:yes stop_codon:yes gene_type:complete
MIGSLFNVSRETLVGYVCSNIGLQGKLISRQKTGRTKKQRTGYYTLPLFW